MAKSSILDWDTTAANNTDIGGIGIQGNNLPSNFDNAQREGYSQIAKALTTGWMLHIRNSSTATLTIDPNGAETINGATTAVLAIGQEAIILCDGSAFYFVARPAHQGH